MRQDLRTTILQLRNKGIYRSREDREFTEEELAKMYQEAYREGYETGRAVSRREMRITEI